MRNAMKIEDAIAQLRGVIEGPGGRYWAHTEAVKSVLGEIDRLKEQLAINHAPAPAVPDSVRDKIIDICDGVEVCDSTAQEIWNACCDAMPPSSFRATLSIDHESPFIQHVKAVSDKVRREEAAALSGATVSPFADLKPNDVIKLFDGQYRVRYIRYTSYDTSIDLQRKEDPLSPLSDTTCIRLTVSKELLVKAEVVGE